MAKAKTVTKNFVKQANGGLYFGNYFEYEGCLKYLLDNQYNMDISELTRIFGGEEQETNHPL